MIPLFWLRVLSYFFYTIGYVSLEATFIILEVVEHYFAICLVLRAFDRQI